MRKIYTLMIALAVLFIMTGCETISDVVGEPATKAVSKAKISKPEKVVGGIDFKKDEALCAQYDRPLEDNTFAAAKILTPPSADTKNQAEVLYVGSGEKEWTVAVIPSHKADKDELTLGRLVFYNDYYNHEDVTDDKYRKHDWYLGRISSTDELFKNVVEVKGKKMLVQWIRIPDEPIE